MVIGCASAARAIALGRIPARKNISQTPYLTWPAAQAVESGKSCLVGVASGHAPVTVTTRAPPYAGSSRAFRTSRKSSLLQNRMSISRARLPVFNHELEGLETWRMSRLFTLLPSNPRWSEIRIVAATGIDERQQRRTTEAGGFAHMLCNTASQPIESPLKGRRLAAAQKKPVQRTGCEQLPESDNRT
ncbi:hypothetical protein OKW44_005917 [Paraburkholderia sp. WSM4174]